MPSPSAEKPYAPTLSPLERAVFVLYEVFGFGHPEILGRSPAAVRQLAARAALGGDLPALFEVLAPEVTLWTDGGGKGPATSLRPVHGRDAVAALFMDVAATLPATGLDIPAPAGRS